NKGDYKGARKLIEKAHEQLPQSYFITSKYILHTVRDKDINDATKLEFLSNDIINNCNDKRIVHNTIHDMVVYYSSVNMHTKAMSL
ncbi:hypothetical protein, partial [Klebsiella pneumoniae]|uniref:hypothetical protein n=1 Tax=Klebsiella pneumoniae TaxID=573 RepID=UPI0025A1C50C